MPEPKNHDAKTREKAASECRAIVKRIENLLRIFDYPENDLAVQDAAFYGKQRSAWMKRVGWYDETAEKAAEIAKLQEKIQKLQA